MSYKDAQRETVRPRRIPPMLEYVQFADPKPAKPAPTNKVVPMRDGTVRRWWTDGSLRRDTMKAVHA